MPQRMARLDGTNLTTFPTVLSRKQVLTKTHPHYKLITRLLNNQPTREAAWKHLIPCPVGASPGFCAETC
jgi:hypothetical protein